MTIEPRPGVPVPSDWLIGEWIDTPCPGNFERFRKAAAWGADEQLRLCVEWFNARGYAAATIEALKAAMRPEPPKPSTLKEQALAKLEFLSGLTDDHDVVRRALETLP
jgi:hypothetical protein